MALGLYLQLGQCTWTSFPTCRLCKCASFKSSAQFSSFSPPVLGTDCRTDQNLCLCPITPNALCAPSNLLCAQHSRSELTIAGRQPTEIWNAPLVCHTNFWGACLQQGFRSLPLYTLPVQFAHFILSFSHSHHSSPGIHPVLLLAFHPVLLSQPPQFPWQHFILSFSHSHQFPWQPTPECR